MDLIHEIARRDGDIVGLEADLEWAVKMIDRAGDLVWTDAEKDRYGLIKRRVVGAMVRGRVELKRESNP